MGSAVCSGTSKAAAGLQRLLQNRASCWTDGKSTSARASLQAAAVEVSQLQEVLISTAWHGPGGRWALPCAMGPPKLQLACRGCCKDVPCALNYGKLTSECAALPAAAVQVTELQKAPRICCLVWSRQQTGPCWCYGTFRTAAGRDCALNYGHLISACAAPQAAAVQVTRPQEALISAAWYGTGDR